MFPMEVTLEENSVQLENERENYIWEIQSCPLSQSLERHLVEMLHDPLDSWQNT